MEKAIIAVREKMGTLKAAKFFKVPRPTLQTLAKKVTLPPKQTAATKLRHRKIVGTGLSEVHSVDGR